LEIARAIEWLQGSIKERHYPVSDTADPSKELSKLSFSKRSQAHSN
jgi:hypothetical protein